MKNIIVITSGPSGAGEYVPIHDKYYDQIKNPNQIEGEKNVFLRSGQ